MYEGLYDHSKFKSKFALVRLVQREEGCCIWNNREQNTQKIKVYLV